MSLRATVLFWLGFAAVFILALYAFRDILLPFVAGAAIAYLLDPIVGRLVRFGFSRTMATALIVVVFVAVLVLVGMVLVPVLVNQVTAFAVDVPNYLKALQTLVHDQISVRVADVVGISRSDFDQRVATWLSDAVSGLVNLLSSVLSGGRAFLSMAALAVVTPVAAFYFLLDWDRMVTQIDNVLPLRHAPTIRALFSEINSTVAALMRGQLSVSLILSAYYAVALSFAGISQGLLIGVATGALSFIPYLGSSLGALLTIGIALIQFLPHWIPVAVVAAIFMVGQFLEGNVLQPWLIGGRIKVHPVWLIFAILAFGNLLGFLGLLIAVPLASVVGVLARFAIRRYLASPLYSGRTPPKP